MTAYVDNLLGAAALALSDRLRSSAEDDSGLGGEAAGALVLIGMRPGRSVKRLAERLRLTHPGAVRLVERLEQEGLVKRAPDSEDRRVVRLTLSRAGEARVGRMMEARAAALGKLTGALSAAEKKALTPLLEKLLAQLTRDAIDAYANCRLCDAAMCEKRGCPVEAKARALADREEGGEGNGKK